MQPFPVMPGARRARPNFVEVAVIAIVASIVSGFLVAFLHAPESVSPQPPRPMAHEEPPKPQPIKVEQPDWSAELAAYSAPRAYEEIGQGEGVPRELCHEALKRINAALRRRPRSSNALCKRAWLRITVGRYKEAAVDAARACRLDPKNMQANEALKTAYSGLGF